MASLCNWYGEGLQRWASARSWQTGQGKRGRRPERGTRCASVDAIAAQGTRLASVHTISDTIYTACRHPFAVGERARKRTHANAPSHSLGRGCVLVVRASATASWAS